MALRTLLFLPLLLLAACRPAEPEAAAPIVEVGVATLAPEEVTLFATLNGRTAASNRAEIRPLVSGIVQRREFREGSDVAAGDVLYRIEASTYRANAEQARAVHASARASVQALRLKARRLAELARHEAASRQDADDAQAAYRQALADVEEKKAAWEHARIELAFTDIKAPIAGRIGSSKVSEGALVSAYQPEALASITRLDPIDVDLTQSSVDLLRLRARLAGAGASASASAAAAVRLVLEDGSAYPHEGELEFREVSVDDATGSVKLQASFPNPDGLLLPGMFVRATLQEAVLHNAIMVPQQGIARDAQGNATAMVVDADGRANLRVVRTDRALGDRWLMRSGLAAGDRVIVQGLNKIKPGEHVAVRPGAEPDAALAAAGIQRPSEHQAADARARQPQASRDAMADAQP